MHENASGSFSRVLKRLGGILDAVEIAAITLLTTTALGIAVYKMFTRYFLPALDPDWGDEIVVYLIVWSAWLACSGLVARDGHIYADLVVRLLPQRLQAALLLGILLACGLFSAGLTYYGTAMTYEAWVYGDISASSLQFPMWIFYAALPVGGALMTVRFIARACLCVRDFAHTTFASHGEAEADSVALASEPPGAAPTQPGVAPRVLVRP